jgi:predicted enzyme related to lactoylglutathione lyase
VQATKKNSLEILVSTRVNNLDATLEKAVEMGARVVPLRSQLPGGFSASFYDLSRNLLALYQDGERKTGEN